MSEERLELEELERETANKDKIHRKYDRPTREMMKAWFAQHVPLWDFNLWWTTRKEKAQE